MTTQTPGLNYYPNHVSHPDQLFWDLMREIMKCKHTNEMDISKQRKTLGTMQVRREDPTRLDNIMRRSRATALPLFSPTVGILAGLAWKQTGLLPDTAALFLYRDGTDWVFPHSDPESAWGPHPENTTLITFSFGATRTLDIYPMGTRLDSLVSGEAKLEEKIAMEAGSMIVMNKNFQKDFLHGVPEEDANGPRICVIFGFKQSKPRACSWHLLETGRTAGPTLSIFVGPENECIDRWVEISSKEGTQGRGLTLVQLAVDGTLLGGQEFLSLCLADALDMDLQEDSPEGLEILVNRWRESRARVLSRLGEG